MIQDESDEEHDLNLGQIPEAEDLDEQERNDDGADTDLAGRDEDEKKTLGFKTTYDGFSIWGWVLCLFIERKDAAGRKASSATAEGQAQALMQDWIESTQERKDDEV